jgi:uncharacterized protein (TIGR02246 family)
MYRICMSSLVLMLSLVAAVELRAVEANPAVQPSNPMLKQLLTAYEKAFDAADPKAIGALWKKDGEFIDPLGNHILGREAIEKLFEDYFSRNPGVKLSIELLSLKEEEQGRVLVAEVIPRVAPPPPGRLGTNKATIVLVRSGENWLIEGIREQTYLPASYEHLKELEWMVGTWTTQKPEKTPANPAEQISINVACQWTANKSFLTRTFTTNLQQLELHGTEIIGWDPQTKTIRSWLFESTGGFAEGAWKFDGKQCTEEMKGVMADGTTFSATNIVTPIDRNTLTYESIDRIRGGQKQPNRGPIKIERVLENAGSKP